MDAWEGAQGAPTKNYREEKTLDIDEG